MAQWMIGESYFHQKNYEAALRAYLQVEILYAYPTWQSGALLQAGKCRELLGEWKEAVQLYEQLLSVYPHTTFTHEAQQRLKAAAADPQRQMKKVPMTRLLCSLASKTTALLAAGLLAALLAIPAAARAETAAPTAKEVAVNLDTPAADRSSPAADRAAIPTKNLWRIMIEGGWAMWPLAFCSFSMVTFFFERLVSLRRGRVIPRPFTKRVLEQIREGHLDREQALALCEENRSAVAQAFAGAVRSWGRPTVEVEQAFLDAGERATNRLRRCLRVFHAISTIGPLLGLLGTVAGIIEAFNAVAGANALGRPELLAGGISKALLTTAFGLIVAIPSLTLYHLFVGRVDQFIMEIDLRSGPGADPYDFRGTGLQNRSQELRISKVRRPAKTESA